MPVQIDIIILSYAKNEELKNLTIATVGSLFASEDPEKILFNVIIIESEQTLKPYQFNNTLTIYPDVEFGYNRYLNIGIRHSSNPYICFCNNDLIFHKNWASNILAEMDADGELQSVSPYCDFFHANNGITQEKNIYSATNGILIGWCIFMKRAILEKVGEFDEHIKFWFADNDYGQTLNKYKVKHALIVNSMVTHLGSKTHATLSDGELFEFTYGQYTYYDFKWHHKSKLVYNFKRHMLPFFRYVYLKKSEKPGFNLLAKAMAKLYGGLRA